MPSFHRVDTSKIVKGAGRIMYAADSMTKPTRLANVIDLTTLDAMSGWSDLGATREGIQISINNSEDSVEIDQVQGEVNTSPANWECSVATRLAEFTLEKMVLAWEGAAISTDTSVTPYERETGFAGATAYTERRLAVLFRKPDQRIQGYFFHRAVRAPQEGVLDFRRTGDPITIPVRFKILADSTVADVLKQFFIVREQI